MHNRIKNIIVGLSITGAVGVAFVNNNAVNAYSPSKTEIKAAIVQQSNQYNNPADDDSLAKKVIQKQAKIENQKKKEAEKKSKEAKKKAEEAKKAEKEKRATEAEQENSQVSYSQTQDYGWSGSVLTPSSGVNYGPTGKETYYNLDMSGVVSIMRNMGYTEESYPYWVRNDGCKMLGNYIMVAANLNSFPRGSIVNCSLGAALVCDTGTFAYSNPTQLDIATTW